MSSECIQMIKNGVPEDRVREAAYRRLDLLWRFAEQFGERPSSDLNDRILEKFIKQIDEIEQLLNGPLYVHPSLRPKRYGGR